jgi:hypothetical protein
VTRRDFLACSCVLASQTQIGTSPQSSLPRFDDVTAASGITFRNQASHASQKYLPETMGSGVAMFDYNKDDLLDLYSVNGAALADPSMRNTTGMVKRIKRPGP